AGKLGMWLFLATEVLLFGGLFCAYAVWRGNHPELFKFGSEYLDTKWGAINTAVLITSSLTMAMAVTFAQQGKQFALKICLLLTAAGALGFLGIKYVEYSHKFHNGWYPGLALYTAAETHVPHHTMDAEGAAMLAEDSALTGEQPVIDDSSMFALPPAEASTVLPPAAAPAGTTGAAVLVDLDAKQAAADHLEGAEHAEHEVQHRHENAHGDPDHPAFRDDRPQSVHMFFNIYFMATGLHGIHVIIGLIVILWIFFRSLKNEFGPEYFTPVDLGGLYWHVVDLIWIFLFPMFYLI
ncbi:MAG: cytochrome c oxidase subunit 3, partial [Phycisphaerales bacterium]|nr:cytochrome c oxidase subunit 3 [Phycisphaerales bacterium]